MIEQETRESQAAQTAEAPVEEIPLVRIYHEESAKRIEITPELATEWLDQNHKNRPLREDGRLVYSEDMAASDWAVNGETIKIDWFGHVMDGQHRLEACVKSGRSFVTWVIMGLNPNTRPTIDTGMARSYRDVLKMEHDEASPYAEIIAPLIARMYLFSIKGERVNWARNKVSHRQRDHFLQENAKTVMYVVKWTAETMGHRRFVVPKSLVAFMYWILIQQNLEEAQEFIQKLVKGIGLEDEEDPIYVLRARLNKEAKPGSRKREYQTDVVWFTMIAWNKWMSGEKVSKLQLPNGGIRPSAWPTLRKTRKIKRPRFTEVAADES